MTAAHRKLTCPITWGAAASRGLDSSATFAICSMRSSRDSIEVATMRHRFLPRRRLAGWQLLPLALLGIAGSVQAADALPARDFSASEACAVVRIVDGDTAVLLLDGKSTTVRLIGVDTAETVDPRKPVDAYGKEASRFLTNLLEGESVYIEYEPTGSHFDMYGRTLAYLYRAPDGLFVNLEIVREGYGHAYTRFPFQYMEL